MGSRTRNVTKWDAIDNCTSVGEELSPTKYSRNLTTNRML
jgi:hypothetical protein